MDKYFASRNSLIREELREQMKARMENKERGVIKAAEALAQEISDLDDGDWFAEGDIVAAKETELQFRRLGFRYIPEEL